MENYAINPYGMSFKQLEQEAARHRCLICGTICKDAPDLSHHRQNKHPRFTCGMCGYKCMTLSRFISHLKSDERCKRHFDGETLPENAEISASTSVTSTSQPTMSGNYIKLPNIVIKLFLSQHKQLGNFVNRKY